MKYIESLNDIVNNNEQVIVVFTNLFREDVEDNYEFKPDGTGFTGYWKIHKASKNAVSNINESNEPSFVIIYLRNNEGNNIYKATISEFEHLDPYVRNVIYFKECQFLGQTLKKWPEFRNDKGQNPVKYIPIGSNINKSEEGKNMSEPQTLKHQLITLLEANHNLVLTGAPGTGKTFLAKQIAKEFTQDIKGTIEFVQFHSSYDYTDFVEGLRPEDSKRQSESIGFELCDGIFKEFCKRAAKKPGHDYVFIIDEINRAEPSRVLGELFFALEPSYRGVKGKVKTQYANLNKEPMVWYDVEEDEPKELEPGYFYVPDNVYIIGTMNDIDRNVDSMDFAMRRRFVWKEISAKDTAEDILKQLPDYDLGELPDYGIEDDQNYWRDHAKLAMDVINEYITKELKDLGTAYHMGPAYFLKLSKYIEQYNGWDNKYEKCDNIWQAHWDYHLEPLLKEYLQGNPKKEEHLEGFRWCWDMSYEWFVENKKK